MVIVCFCRVFFFKQKTAYEMRISDWSSDVCSSDLRAGSAGARPGPLRRAGRSRAAGRWSAALRSCRCGGGCATRKARSLPRPEPSATPEHAGRRYRPARSEEHTSELQSLMRTSYAVFCLKKNTYIIRTSKTHYFITINIRRQLK